MRIISAIIISVLLVGCTKKVYIPTESVRTESASKIHSRIDTVERYVEKISELAGDTIKVTIRDIQYRVRLDTVYIQKYDSLERPILITPPKQNVVKQTWWQRLKTDISSILIIIASLCAIWLVLKLFLKMMSK